MNFLTIGGGYSPSGNQVSLEKNVQYLNRMLIKENLGDAPHSVYFADGDSDGRDLQYLDPKFKIPKINEYLARFVGSTKGIQNQYRSHKLDTDGASKSANIAKWFDTKGKKLCDEKDKLLVYLTGHGGRGEKKKPNNTVMYLWQDKNLRVSEFVKELDKLPTEVPVTVVMVQCYSGGFANIIFNEGDADKGLTDHTRAGFCATIHDWLLVVHQTSMKRTTGSIVRTSGKPSSERHVWEKKSKSQTTTVMEKPPTQKLMLTPSSSPQLSISQSRPRTPS